jgi:hypothetical protein
MCKNLLPTKKLISFSKMPLSRCIPQLAHLSITTTVSTDLPNSLAPRSRSRTVDVTGNPEKTYSKADIIVYIGEDDMDMEDHKSWFLNLVDNTADAIVSHLIKVIEMKARREGERYEPR